MGKSAEVIDGKGVGSAPLRKRVRKYMKEKGLDVEERLQVGRFPESSFDSLYSLRMAILVGSSVGTVEDRRGRREIVT